MKINFDKTLKNFDRKDAKGPNGETANIKEAIVRILTSEFKDETIDGVEKFERANLANKVFTGTEAYKVEELTKIKELVGKAGTALLVWNVYNIIDKGEVKGK